MKTCFTLLFILSSVAGFTQQPDTVKTAAVLHVLYERHSVMATLSVGFVDYYRQYYAKPHGYNMKNTSGFAPLYLKLEYGLYKHTSIAINIGYDAFSNNYNQDYIGNNGPFTRYRTNNTRIWSVGISANYHLEEYIHIRHLDPFIGVGVSLNNIRYSAFPQGDSSVIKFDHTVSPCLKAGARYYISGKFSLFGDVGYDQQSIFSVGFTCRFFHDTRAK